jgi:hypothetical protein
MGDEEAKIHNDDPFGTYSSPTQIRYLMSFQKQPVAAVLGKAPDFH